jgi:hypothetical protein
VPSIYILSDKKRKEGCKKDNKKIVEIISPNKTLLSDRQQFGDFPSLFPRLKSMSNQSPPPLILAAGEVYIKKVWIEEGNKCRPSSQDFTNAGQVVRILNSPRQIAYSPFCAFIRILTVVLPAFALTINHKHLTQG